MRAPCIRFNGDYTLHYIRSLPRVRGLLSPEFMQLTVDIYGEDLAVFLFTRVMVECARVGYAPFMHLPVFACIYDADKWRACEYDTARRQRANDLGCKLRGLIEDIWDGHKYIQVDVRASPVIHAPMRIFWGWIRPVHTQPRSKWLKEYFSPMSISWGLWQNASFLKNCLVLAQMLLDGASREETVVEFFRREMGTLRHHPIAARGNWIRDPALSMALRALATADVSRNRAIQPNSLSAAPHAPPPPQPSTRGMWDVADLPSSATRISADFSQSTLAGVFDQLATADLAAALPAFQPRTPHPLNIVPVPLPTATEEDSG